MIDRICDLTKMQVPLRNRGLLSASGTVVPTDGTDGYQTGCTFKHTDGGNNTSFYVNEGSVTSCQFNALTTGGPADTLVIGAFASLIAGSGIPISSTQTGAALIYSDDAGANIATSCRGLLSRFLLTTDASGSSIRALMGQLKLTDLTDVETGVYTAVQGYVELAGTSIAKANAHFSCFDASLEIASGETLTVNQYGKVAGLYVETTGAGTITVDSGGLMAGVVITKATGAPDWPLGILISGKDVTEGLRVGSFVSTTATLGVTLSTTVTAANRFYSDDGNAAIVNTGVNDTRGVLSRVLATADHSANELRLFALEGQLKAYNATWDNEMCAGVYGYLEFVNTGSTTYDGYGFTAGVMSCVESNGAMVIGTNHVLSGFCAVSKIKSTLTATGKTVAFHAAIYNGTNWSSGGEDETAWEYGLFVAGGSVSVAGVQLGSDGSSAGDLVVYGEASGSYLQYDEDANSCGRLILANSTFRQTQIKSLNECAMAIYLKADVTGADAGNARTLIVNCDCDADVTLTEDSAGGMVGLESSCRIEGTLNGAGLDIFGITGQLYGSPVANTVVKKMAAIHASNQCTLAPGTGDMYLFHGVNHAAITMDAGLILTMTAAGTFTAGIEFDPGSGTFTTGITIGACTTNAIACTGECTGALVITGGTYSSGAIQIGAWGTTIKQSTSGDNLLKMYAENEGTTDITTQPLWCYSRLGYAGNTASGVESIVGAIEVQAGTTANAASPATQFLFGVKGRTIVDGTLNGSGVWMAGVAGVVEEVSGAFTAFKYVAGVIAYSTIQSAVIGGGIYAGVVVANAGGQAYDYGFLFHEMGTIGLGIVPQGTGKTMQAGVLIDATTTTAITQAIELVDNASMSYFLRTAAAGGCVVANTANIAAGTQTLQHVILVDINGDIGYIPVIAGVPS